MKNNLPPSVFMAPIEKLLLVKGGKTSQEPFVAVPQEEVVVGLQGVIILTPF